ncbi:MAG: hypothetical protein VKK04_25705 [Synechococcales bacterium]|nr:hypothetical protein [Synechococcales bacterium]
MEKTPDHPPPCFDLSEIDAVIAALKSPGGPDEVFVKVGVTYVCLSRDTLEAITARAS